MIEINEYSIHTVEDPDAYIIIQRPKGKPVSADEARWLLSRLGVSAENIRALTWENYKEEAS
jgi:hypothetical protein